MTLSGIDSKLSETDFTLFITSPWSESDRKAKGTEKYIRSLNYRNKNDSNSLENCVEICAH